MEIINQTCIFFHVFFVVTLSFCLDIFCGDPRILFSHFKHPVCYVGDLLNVMEKVGRFCIIQNKGHEENAQDQKLIGIFCLLLVVGITSYAVYFLSNLPYIGWFITFYLAFTGLAAGSLIKTFNKVLTKIEYAPLEQGQKALGQLVSRDTAVLNQRSLRKSLADTLSENVTDAVVAPLFWLLVGSFGGITCGVTTLWAYKAVSTADSMWGYKTKKWINLGYGAAKADDILAYIPARLGVVFLWLTHFFDKTHFFHYGNWPGFNTIAKQAAGMQSPNSGWPMAACAWLFNAGLGGPTQYFGSVLNKPWVGKYPIMPWNEKKLQDLSKFVKHTAYTGFVVMFTLWAIIYWGFLA